MVVYDLVHNESNNNNEWKICIGPFEVTGNIICLCIKLIVIGELVDAFRWIIRFKIKYSPRISTFV